MKILLIAATSDEIIKECFSKSEILISGVGMVNTTYALTKHLRENSYDLVVNMGVAGCFNSAIKIGDVVEVVEDHFSEIGFENGEEFENFSDFEITSTFKVEGKTNLQKVKGITVNTVHGNEDSIARIISRLNPDVESMEGAAIFKVCKEFAVPCMQIRAISNKVEKRNRENWNMPLAIQNLNTTVQQIIVAL
ncbi:MAG TPA: futalosine hydrolase [Flavobacteriales bacterium]|nr:futalosine hydrolase [Flavobacteriales bacterium]